MPHAAARVAVPILLAALPACTRYDTPRFRVVSITERERTDEAVVLGFTIEAKNRNDEPLPLQQARYSLELDGIRVFEGARLARVTAPRFGVQELELPAVVPLSSLPAGRFDEAGEVAYRLEGVIEYQTPGRFAEFLFDLNVRRPKAPIGLAGTLEWQALSEH